jgi:serine protease Do
MNENTFYSQRRNDRAQVNRVRAILLTLFITGTGAFTWTQLQAREEAKTPPVKLTVNAKPVSRETGITSFAPVVKKVTPSVVKVYVSASVKNVAHQSPQLPDELANNPWLRRFFGDEFNGPDLSPRGRRNETPPRQRGMGSGVIVTRDGYLLTNNHVVDNADEVKVALADGREFVARIVGKDPQSDVAVLKIDAKDLPAVELGDSDNLEVGDVVLAIGNPFGVGQTVTSGIISATGRGSLGLDYEDMIQTDAAINPGNSGGALVDAEGRLIGINTAILSRSGGNQGIGFAVPANLARSVMEGLVRDGRVVRGFMGVNVQNLTPALAREFGVKDSQGALVAGITPKSPAEKAGVKEGDVVLEFNRKPVKDSRHLKLQVAQIAPGTAVPVKVLRDGKTHSLSVTVKELPGQFAAKNSPDAGGESTDALAGVAVDDLDATSKQQLKAPAGLNGAIVTRVEPNTPAFEAGLREGDVIIEINRKAVKNAEEAVQLTQNAKDKRTLLRVWSKGGSRFVVVDEGQG